MDYRLITTLEDFDRLAPTWNTLLSDSITNSPFLRHEYLQTWWQTLGGGEWEAGQLAIVTATEHDELRGVAPLFLTENNESEPALVLLGGIEVSDYLDVIVRQRDLSGFISGLLDFLAGSGQMSWRLLEWYNLLEDSPTLIVLKNEAMKRGWSFTQERFRPALYIPLPGDFETYLGSLDKKQRHEIRRKMRRAVESNLNIRWYIVEEASTLDFEIDDFLRIMAQEPKKERFLTPLMRSQMRAAIRAAFRAGWLQMAFLEIDGEKACGYLNFDYDNRIWVYNSGIDGRFIDLSPGWVLLGHLLQWANDHQYTEFDFMRGDENYKYKFGAVARFVVRAKVVR
jgi:CelD/BcsL family acetyltransferase involved in cellulose biosynthesis